MNQAQILTIALSTVPTMLTVLVGILINNARLGDLNASVNSRFDDMNTRMTEVRAHFDSRFEEVDRRFDDVDRRFDEMKDLWRSELHRVEEVIDARLKHLEERF